MTIDELNRKLLEAAKRGDIEDMMEALKQGAEVNSRDGWAEKPLSSDGREIAYTREDLIGRRRAEIFYQALYWKGSTTSPFATLTTCCHMRTSS